MNQLVCIKKLIFSSYWQKFCSIMLTAKKRDKTRNIFPLDNFMLFVLKILGIDFMFHIPCECNEKYVLKDNYERNMHLQINDKIMD